MLDPEITRSLVRLGFDDFMMAIVNASLSRGNSAPMNAVRALAQLIEALSVALNDSDRAASANFVRDAADVLERPLITHLS